jgi:phosphohistidine phosphatase
MRLIIVRHAHAHPGTPDAGRHLSRRGRKQVRKLASFLRETELQVPGEIWHSPLIRAGETATLLAKHLKLRAPTVEKSGLEPEASPALTARRLAHRDRPLTIVGHEPHLSALASLLVTGSREPPVFVMRKCTALALERQGGRWLVTWMIPPELLP